MSVIEDLKTKNIDRTKTVALSILLGGVIALIISIVDFFMGNGIFGLEPIYGLIVMIVVFLFMAGASHLLYNKYKIGYILSIIAMVALIVIGIFSLIYRGNTIFMGVFYIALGIIIIIDMMKKEVRFDDYH